MRDNISTEQRIVTDLLGQVGVVPNGPNPWDIQVHDPKVYAQVLSGGSIGLGETYMEGLWDCQALDQFIFKVLRGDLQDKVRPNLEIAAHYIKNRFINLQSKRRAFDLKHYDIGNELYKKMLDKRMTYTCGYWKNADNLDQAQEAKLDLICRKVGLKPGMKVLDIGCGWGSFMKYAAENYRVSCVGITISQAQTELGRELCQGLPIEFRLQDYRDITGEYDAVVSIGMFEHVGPKNYKTFMRAAHKALKKDGLFLLHCMGGNNSNPAKMSDPWMNKYIFPGGTVPSLPLIGKASEKYFIVEDWHNLGPNYDKTLLAWYGNFERAWPELKKYYSETFHRMWRFYLLSCSGASRARDFQLWQIVMSKEGVLGGYTSIR